MNYGLNNIDFTYIFILHLADVFLVFNMCKVLNIMIRKSQEDLRGYNRDSSTDLGLSNSLQEVAFT